MTIGQEEQQAERGEQHGWHVELRHHRLRVKEWIDKQEYDGENGRRAIARQFTAQEIGSNDGPSGERQHGRSRGGNGITRDSPHQREIRHYGRRMRIRHRGVRDPRAITQNVERRRNELAEFVPEIRQSEIRKMRDENQKRERGENQERAEADRPH